MPDSWRFLCKQGENWKPVTAPSGYDVAEDRFNEVRFAPVRTAAVRVEVQLRPGWSAGICEWEVE